MVDTNIEEIEGLRSAIKDLQKQNTFLTNKVADYEEGDAKMFYALQKKMAEMSRILNGTNLENIDISSKSDASFDRIFKVLEKAEIVANAAKSFGAISGIVKEESIKDNLSRKGITPESVADNVGELAGKRY